MAEVFGASLSAMMMMFACMVVGFVLNKKRLLPENTATVLSKLENYVLVPSLVVGNFSKYCTVAAVRERYTSILYSLVVLAVAIGIAYLLCGLFDKHAYRKNLYKYGLVIGNFGFLGNAVVLMMFGEEMLFQYQMFTLPMQMAVYAWGLPILIPRGEQRKKPLRNLLNPPLIGLAIGVVLGLTGARAVMPMFLTDTLSGLGAGMGPVAMVMTGFVVGGYDARTLFANKKVYALSGMRLLVLPVLLTVLVLALGAPPQTAVFCLLAYAAPMGLNTVVFPAAYGEDTSVGASMALVSHIAGVVTLPLLYTLLKTIV